MLQLEVDALTQEGEPDKAMALLDRYICLCMHVMLYVYIYVCTVPEVQVDMKVITYISIHVLCVEQIQEELRGRKHRQRDGYSDGSHSHSAEGFCPDGQGTILCTL